MNAIAFGCAGVASESPVSTSRGCQRVLAAYDGDEAELRAEAARITQSDLLLFSSRPVCTRPHL